MRFFLNYFSLRIQVKFDTEIQNWMLILIFAPIKSGFEDDFGQSNGKTHYFTLCFGQTPLRNTITITIPEVPGD